MTDQTTRFRKLPVEIEAVHFDGTHQSVLAAMRFVDAGRTTNEIRVHAETDPAKSWIAIPTLEGTMRADAGDWIIRGVKGELYPCKPDVFATTYEPAVPLPPADPTTPLRDRIAHLDLDAISARAADAQQYGVEDDGFEQLVRDDVPALVAEVRRLRAAVLPEPADRAAALSETERRMLEYAFDLADEEVARDGSDFTDEEEDALAELRRIVTKPIATGTFELRGDSEIWAAVLREAADVAEDEARRLYDDMGQKAAAGARLVGDRLRRMADETATTETQAHATVRRKVADDFRALFGNVVLKGQDGDWANVADYIATGARIPACGSFYPHHTDTRCSLAKGHRGSHIAPWGTRTMAWPYDPSETQPAAGARQDGADRG